MNVTIRNRLTTPIHITVFLLTGKNAGPMLRVVGTPAKEPEFVFPAYAYVITATPMLADSGGEPALRKFRLDASATDTYAWDESRSILVALYDTLTEHAKIDQTEDATKASTNIVIQPADDTQSESP